MKLWQKITMLALIGGVFFVPNNVKAEDKTWCKPVGGAASDCANVALSSCLTGEKFNTEAECKDYKWCVTGTDVCQRTATCSGPQYNSQNECVLALEAEANKGPEKDTTIQPTTGGKGTIVQLVNPIGGSDANPEGVTNLFQIVGGVMKAVMGILGSLTLLVFIYGGFEWVTAAGNSEKVSNGVNAMTYAAIGICVIFSSYAIINLLFSTLTGGSDVDTNPQAGDVWCLNAQNACAAMPASECKGNTYPNQGECQNAVNPVEPPQSE